MGSTWRRFPAAKPGQFSATWETVLVPPETGSYEFILVGSHQACLLIDGIVVLHRFEGGAETTGKSLDLHAGIAYQLRVELWPSRPDLRIKLGWIPPWVRDAEDDDEALLDAAKRADAVLFFGGLSHQYDLEGTDRKDMALHEGQNELIARIAEVNARDCCGASERFSGRDAMGKPSSRHCPNVVCWEWKAATPSLTYYWVMSIHPANCR